MVAIENRRTTAIGNADSMAMRSASQLCEDLLGILTELCVSHEVFLLGFWGLIAETKVERQKTMPFENGLCMEELS